MSRAGWIPAVLFAASVSLFLVTASVTWAFNDAGVYRGGFQKYRVSETTGITATDLRQVAADLRHYFNSKEEPLLVRTRVFGVEQDIFGQREVLHMRDVKRLVWWVYAVATLTGLYLMAATTVGLVYRRHQFATTLARWLLWGGGLTVALILAVGLFALAGFDTLFLKFHQLSFSNDLWQLDRQSYLLRLFPQGFWFDATMRVAVTTLAGAVVLILVSGGYLLRHRWTGRKAAQEPNATLEEAREV